MTRAVVVVEFEIAENASQQDWFDHVHDVLKTDLEPEEVRRVGVYLAVRESADQVIQVFRDDATREGEMP